MTNTKLITTQSTGMDIDIDPIQALGIIIIFSALIGIILRIRKRNSDRVIHIIVYPEPVYFSLLTRLAFEAPPFWIVILWRFQGIDYPVGSYYLPMDIYFLRKDIKWHIRIIKSIKRDGINDYITFHLFKHHLTVLRHKEAILRKFNYSYISPLYIQHVPEFNYLEIFVLQIHQP